MTCSLIFAVALACTNIAEAILALISLCRQGRVIHSKMRLKIAHKSGAE